MKKDFDKNAIGALIDRKIREASGTSFTKLSDERRNLLKYYNGELPARSGPGRSSYVSRDVFDGVESLKAQLLETFSGGHDIVRFSPVGPKDVVPAKIATSYTNYIFWRLNDGETILQNVVHDALLSRVGIVKVYWQPDVEEEAESFGPISEMELEALLAQEDIPDAVADLDEATGLYTGTLTRRVADRSRVVVEPIPPEEFGIEPSAKDLDAFHYHKTMKSKAELKSLGFDVKLLKDIKPDIVSTVADDMETDARFSQIDTGQRSTEARDEDKKYWVYECYTKLAHPDGNRECLYKIVRVGSVTLAMDEVSRSPFKVYVPLPVSHMFWGNSFARLLIPAQNARTVLIRSVLDHTAITTNPRYLVEQGGLVSPRELLENRLGGIVNITRPDAVQPLPQAPLNPFVFQTQDMIKTNAEQSTGISALSVGQDKDVISNQNSAALVAQQVDLASIRQRLPARRLAAFLREVWLEIYAMVIENTDKRDVIDVAGEWVDIDPRTWASRKTVEVTMHLSPGDREQAAMKKVQFFTMARADGDLNNMITPDNAYQFALDAAEGANIRDINAYITHPTKIPPKEPDQMALKQMELQERAVAVQENNVKAMLQKIEAEHAAKVAKLELDKAKMEHDFLIKELDAKRKELETLNRIDVAQRELAMAEAAPTMEPSKAIISPNS